MGIMGKSNGEWTMDNGQLAVIANFVRRVRQLFEVASSVKILIFISLIFGVAQVNAQKSRTSAMGGVTYSVIDQDESFDPFQLGGNTAWLVNSKLQTRLDISPEYNSHLGNYRRLFSAERVDNYNTNFIGVKPLGASGTFMGKASYDYQVRKNNYRTLTKDTYAGDAFFFTDTTTGNTTYNGPLFELSHSLRIYKSLYAGGGIGYKILNGLKDVYTYGETVFRNVYGNFGLAYQFPDNIVAGISIRSFNSQERIEASDVNLMTVRTYHWRGETHFIELRGSSQNYKLAKNGNVLSTQLYFHPNNKIEIGMAADYDLHSTKVLFPVGSLIDVADGYADFDYLTFRGKARYAVSDNLLAAVSISAFNNHSWSENVKHNTLLWEWNYSGAKVGFGGSYNFNSRLLIAAELEGSYIYSDSSKYIDDKNSSVAALNSTLRIGAEYYASGLLTLRGGYNFIHLQHDFLIGGENVLGNNFTFGAGYKLSDLFDIDGTIQYFRRTCNSNDKSNSDLSLILTLRFFTF
jgi:hypothetical protein